MTTERVSAPRERVAHRREGAVSVHPRVSVIIPTYDRLPLLEQAVRSVRAQTERRWELIVVDDGSTDGTREFLRAIDDDRVRCIECAHTGNVAALRNAGARAAAADLLAFLDDDDLWLPRKLEIQIERMRAAGVPWSYTRYEHISETGTVVPPLEGEWKECSGWIAEEIISTEAAAVICTLIVERDTFRHLGGFVEASAPFREDLDLSIRLALHAPALAVPESLVHVRIHPGRTTSAMTGAAPFLASANVYDKALERVSDRRLRRAARRQRAWHLAEAGARLLRAGSPGPAMRLMLRSLGDRPLSRQWASALARGLGLRT